MSSFASPPDYFAPSISPAPFSRSFPFSDPSPVRLLVLVFIVSGVFILSLVYCSYRLSHPNEESTETKAEDLDKDNSRYFPKALVQFLPSAQKMGM
ncbi:hypothetical protein M8C21_012539 [Ambrosia artemisiifolia]|uniref:Transmembrane protein n=1 Tax=Ambrosia artemisiifolia TaxID=4212 RepID=A0AAD5C1P7_AMBAR|nr:hypothetical protein M8C21_012539 [Ambrosia artemisiifolia]